MSVRSARNVCVHFDRGTKFILATMEILITMISKLLFEYYYDFNLSSVVNSG